MIVNLSRSLVPVPSGTLKILLSTELAPPTEPVYLSLIIPTYNEGKNILAVVHLLSYLLDEALPNNYELVVIDDDSPDGTWEIAQQLMADYPRLRVMRRQGERGLSTAVIRGWQVAKGQVLGVIDGDLQHPPEVLMKLLKATEQGADLAVASRHVTGGGTSDWRLNRRILSRGAQLLGLIILPSVVGRVSDPMSGYFLVRREAIAGRLMNPLGYKILIEVIGRGEIHQIAEVAYVFQERQEGASKVTWRQYLEYIIHLVQLRFW
ncbi:polyprenol monophosphomannose synthase [Cylindrospermum sp. FACHB-282]|nr:polyprenol monophosphomannose synthase [Cylindrospermum sp. FACHB-282]